ncbi:MAG: sugar transferase [Flavobacteriales bacterium]|nr:sugar transferase [Flavobacteriales bacterium]
MKRIFDILASFAILAAFFPVGIIISLSVLLSSKGGVFYIQERIGKDKQPFGLLKFRTMVVGSDGKGKLTVGTNDIRITSIGRILRKFKLDEFPQFINVLFGQMSIVGPRPEVKEYVDLYTKEQLAVLNVKPGITDLASLEYFNENELLGNSKDPQKTYIEEVMPAKIALNKKYLANASLLNDIKIMWRTFLKIVRF